ncbi:MAG TPA: hypothetical protein VNK70_00450 [Candidatus Paceibacterota bacterium]|nr:hypothetical protein [Candidatus Paceibacterota bacterium]
MKNKILIAVLIAVAAVIAVYLYGSGGGSDNETPVAPVSEVPVPGSEGVPEMIVEGGAKNVITYTDAGFSPNPLSVKAGETVTFVNESQNPFWPASAMHPTHKVYPGSDIEKCGTAEEPNIFDACRGIPTGEQWSFVFGEVGSWNYHDHLNPNNFGKIIVE